MSFNKGTECGEGAHVCRHTRAAATMEGPHKRKHVSKKKQAADAPGQLRLGAGGGGGSVQPTVAAASGKKRKAAPSDEQKAEQKAKGKNTQGNRRGTMSAGSNVKGATKTNVPQAASGKCLCYCAHGACALASGWLAARKSVPRAGKASGSIPCARPVPRTRAVRKCGPAYGARSTGSYNGCGARIQWLSCHAYGARLALWILLYARAGLCHEFARAVRRSMESHTDVLGACWDALHLPERVGGVRVF